MSAAVLAICFTACSGTGAAEDTRPTRGVPSGRTSSTAVSSTSSASRGEEVLAAYLSYWEMVIRVNDPPNPSDAEIPKRTTGDQLVLLIQTLQENEAKHRVIRRPANSRSVHRPRVTSIESGRATIEDCAIDDLVVSNSQTGEVVDDDIVTVRIVSVMVIEQGEWKVSEAQLGPRMPGVSECAS